MVALQGTYTRADFARFQYFHQLRRIWPAILLILVITLALMLLIAARPDPNLIANVSPLLAMFAIWLILLGVSPWWAAYRQAARQPYLRDMLEFSFTALGYRLKGTGFSSEVQWGVLRVLRETKSLFLLYQAPNLAVIVPKRFFESQIQMNTWRQMAEAGIAPRKISVPRIGKWF